MIFYWKKKYKHLYACLNMKKKNVEKYNISIKTDKNECDLSPCQNNGTCINSLGSYKCECEKGWQGQDCHIGKFRWSYFGKYIKIYKYAIIFFIILLLDVDECLSTPCANNGTCINNKGSYTCVCKRGWTDLNCDIGMSCNACKNWPFNKKNWISKQKQDCIYLILIIFRCWRMPYLSLQKQWNML